MLCVGIPTVNASDDVIEYDNIEVRLLQSLNILSLSETNGDFSLEGNITRGQFALYVARLLMIDEVSNEGEQCFDDVPSDHYAYGFINGLVERDIIAKSSDGKFYPNEYITYEQAVKILVVALGYYPHAVAQGGWVSGYINVAKSLELTDGVKAALGQPISKATAVKLIYNSLNIGLAEMTIVTNNSATYKTSDEDTLLSLRNIYMYEGQVNGIYETGLNGDSSGVNESQVKVGAENFDVGSTDIRKYFGEFVRFYYEEDESENKTVLFIEGSESKVTELDAEDIVKFSNSAYYYETDDSGKTKRVVLEPGFDVIYNNRVPTAEGNSYMVPQTGTVKIIDNSKTDVSSVVIISEYENYVASTVDARSEKIYTKDNGILDLGSVEYKIFNDNGAIISVDSVKADSVLSVFKSDDDKLMDIYVTTEQFEGKLNTIGTKEIAINGKEYKVIGNFEMPSVGTDVKVYLDIKGNVAYLEKGDAQGDNYGYLLKAYYEDDDEGRVRLRVLTSKGAVEDIYLSEKIRINDVRVKEAENAYTLIKNVSKNIIKYELSSSKITNLYTYDGTSKNYIHQLYNGRYKYNAKQRTFGGKLTLADDALVFVVSPDASPEDYVVTNKSTFGNDKFYDFEAYTFGDSPFAEVIIRSTASIAYEKTLSIVTKVTSELDQYDEIRTRVDILHGGKQQSHYLKSNDLLGDVEAGDVVRISLALNDDIEGILHVYDKSEEEFLLANPYQPESANGYYSNNRIIFGNVYSMEDGLMKITTETPSTSIDSSSLENCLASQFTVYVYEDGDEVCGVGSYLDIVSYEQAGSNYSKVIVATNWGDPTDIIIIN